MTFPASHKTVFVLDHSPYFLTSCQQHIEFDIFTKTRQPGIIPLAPISKSLWTCSVEAAIEYCRVVWDIFPANKLVRFVVSDTAPRFLNSWSQEDQNMTNLMSLMAQLGPPSESGNAKDYNVLNGLTAAVEALCQCSEIQHEYRTSLTDTAGKIVNRGRIICVTSMKSDSEIRVLEDRFYEVLVAQNKLAASSDSLMSVHKCELVLIHTCPVNKESENTPVSKRNVGSLLTCEVHKVRSGRNLAAKLGYLVQLHYNLASTTVTGIPMKEEQNANSSANYDVELLHPSGAHADLMKTGFSNTEGVHVCTVKEGQAYETVTLKWCTPRSNSVELQYCTGAYRITPVDINSRPSSCLTNFLLSGRAVMLEMPRKVGSKIMSHMLASHGGEICIHTLGTGRSTLEDPPSISEGCGGRVTDYRINDFGEFMKENKLLPYRPKENDRHEPPIERTKKRLYRLTQYWPMVISHTTIFNMASQLDPLLTLITKEVLSQEEVVECKKVVYQLVTMENKGTSLPVPTIGMRGKGPKREEQYRTMWNELENYVRMHCVTAEHNIVLDCLLECRKPLDAESSNQKGNATAPVKKAQEKVPEKGEGKWSEVDFGWKESKIGEQDQDRVPAAKKARISNLEDGILGNVSLLTLWRNKVNAENAKRHVEFAGRLNADGKVAQLYANLNVESVKTE
ncbi:integrator complex subunit 13-like [Ornithodoros turicata]|uniref:Protein asunder n=1 Tax=Ornithodoros turicata TaxID=34597 RepID=A0A2R5LJL0_9ACAR